MVATVIKCVAGEWERERKQSGTVGLPDAFPVSSLESDAL